LVQLCPKSWSNCEDFENINESKYIQQLVISIYQPILRVISISFKIAKTRFNIKLLISMKIKNHVVDVAL
jgi:hypothetical protein